MSHVRHIKLRKGQRVHLPGGAFAVLRRLDHRVQLEHEESGELRTLSDFEIGQHWMRGDLEFAVEDAPTLASKPGIVLPDPAAYPKEIAEEVERRLAFARAFAASTRSRTEASAAAFLASAASDLAKPSPEGDPVLFRKPGPRTLLRWVAAVWEAGATAGAALVPTHHRKGNRGLRLDDRVEAMLAAAINEVFLRRPRNPATDVYTELLEKIQKAQAAGEPLEMPAVSTIRRRIRDIDGHEAMAARHGKRAADRAYTPVGRLPEPERPLQVVQIDHTRLDVFVFDDAGKRRVLARPTLTLAVDVFSRAIWGMHIGFDPPSYAAVMNCLWNGIRPKHGDLERAGVGGDGWPCLGLPETIVIDNGKEFHSHALKHAAAMLGIGIVYAPAGAPERKPHIERLVGTFNREVAHRMPGTTFSNVRAKGDYKPEKDAVHDISFLRARAVEWVSRIYHRRPHRGIGEPPLARWDRGIERHPPVLPPNVRDLRVLLCRTVEGCSLSRHGVQIEELRYNSGDLGDILAEAGEDRIAVDVRMDPDDIGSIHVLHPRRKAFVEVPCLDVDYARGLSLHVHREIRKARRKAMREGERDPALVADQARFRRSLQGPNPRKKPKPGGAREARRLGSKLDATIRDAVVNGGGAAPGWAVAAAIPSVEAVTADGWPIAAGCTPAGDAPTDAGHAAPAPAEAEQPRAKRRPAVPPDAAPPAAPDDDEDWGVETFTGPDRG